MLNRVFFVFSVNGHFYSHRRYRWYYDPSDNKRSFIADFGMNTGNMTAAIVITQVAVSSGQWFRPLAGIVATLLCRRSLSRVHQIQNQLRDLLLFILLRLLRSLLVWRGIT